MPDALDLLTAACPGDPALDLALTHALLRDVAAGRRGATLRVFRPGSAVAFGRLDRLRPGFAVAAARAREHGRHAVLRSVGGHAAVYDERSVTVEHVTSLRDMAAGIQERFGEQAAILRDVLAGLGADARVGAIAGEYCRGAYSVNVGGRVKVAGIAQRVVRGAALTSAIVVVGGGADVRATVAAVYAALGLDVDPATAGALDEELPGLTARDVCSRLRAAYGRRWTLVPREPDDGLLAAARGLAGGHRLAPAPQS